MDPVEAKRAIAARWIERWPIESAVELGSAVSYTIDNVRQPEGDGFFARLAIIALTSDQETMGPVGRRRIEHTGIIEVRLSCLPNIGTDDLSLLARAVRRVFRLQRIGRSAWEKGIVTHATEEAELRRDAEGTGRWILACSTPFEFTEIA